MFALTILGIYQVFPLTIQQVAFPFFSEQSSNHKKWYASYLKYNKLNHLLVVFVVGGGILFFPALVNFFFSGKYERSIFYFIFLSIAWMIKTANMMKGTAIMGYGRFDINFRASVITLVLTFSVTFLLIKYYGLIGSMIGMITGALIYYVTFYFIFRRFNKTLDNGV
jgi:O-antigen/teichoic acid export membrane protein